MPPSYRRGGSEGAIPWVRVGPTAHTLHTILTASLSTHRRDSPSLASSCSNSSSTSLAYQWKPRIDLRAPPLLSRSQKRQWQDHISPSCPICTASTSQRLPKSESALTNRSLLQLSPAIATRNVGFSASPHAVVALLLFFSRTSLDEIIVAPLRW